MSVEENLRKQAVTEEVTLLIRPEDGETAAQRKQLLEQRQLALKVSCNAIYGFKRPGWIHDDEVRK